MNPQPGFSICIPNFNYERYLGRTIESVRAQRGDAVWQVVLSDNASTDASVKVAEGFGDARIKVHVNRRNVGFAGNLDRAARMAELERLIMLSSDDLMRPEALTTYRGVLAALGADAAASVLTSTMDQIDGEDRSTGRIGPDPELWNAGDVDASLSATLGATVYRVRAAELLRRSMRAMKNPFNFAATCYARSAWEAVEGYGAARLMNPDKWFHWKLLCVADQAVFIDAPLFAYRWHAANQTAQEAGAGALRFLVDEYVTTLDADAVMLQRAGLSKEELMAAFVERDIARHGLAVLAAGNRAKARRIFHYGLATFPAQCWRNTSFIALAALLGAGAPGARLAAVAHAAWRRRMAP